MSTVTASKADSRVPLPPIPAKRYFTIGEVSELCGVKPHVLRYWEQEFTQLRPMKRRGNRRYYQHHEVLLVRRIRELLYEQGFTISGARNRLSESAHNGRRKESGVVAASAVAVASAVADVTAAAPGPALSAIEALRLDLTTALQWLLPEPEASADG